MSIIKRMLSHFDLFLGYIAFAVMNALFYIFSLTLFIGALLGFLVGPFEGKFSFDELDNFEILGFIAFIFVTVRFFKRGNEVGLSVWFRLKRYVQVSAIVAAIYATIYYLIISILVIDRGEVTLSDLNTNSDFQYFSFCLLYLISLYTFAPLPKVAWIQSFKHEFRATMKEAKKEEKHKATEKEQEAPTQASEGSAHTCFNNTENK